MPMPEKRVEYCCKKMIEAQKDKHIVLEDDGSITAPGCCGGCYILFDLFYCPFCGVKMQIVEASE